MRAATVLGVLAVLAGLPAAAAAAGLPPIAPVIDAVPVNPDEVRVPASLPLKTTAAGCPRGRTIRARRAAVICLVNRARAQAGLRGFRAHPALGRAAARHARDMARARFFGHQRAGGPSLALRARRAGWRGKQLGEAIAYGCGRGAGPASIVRSWLGSSPHRAILLSTRLSKVGLGLARRAPVSCGGRGATFVLDAGR